jgi:hypothetical protein
MTTIDLSENLKMVNSEDGKYKGLIFDHSDQLVVSNFPIAEEIVIDSTNPKLSLPETNQKFYELIEGSILRVYYYRDEWCISTNGRLDAFSSFWANTESFGKQFENLIFTLTREQLDFDEFCCGLDKAYNYFFLLPTFENNRIGATEDSSKFYLIGLEHINDRKLITDSLSSYFTNTQLWSYPSQITRENVLENGGIMVSDKSTTKFITLEYKSNVELRNNEPNLYKRYLELLLSDPVKAEKLKNIHKQVDFEYVIHQPIKELVSYAYKCYVHRFIYKEHIKVAQVIHFLLGLCHKRYLETRSRMTEEIVKDVLFQQSIENVFFLLFS